MEHLTQLGLTDERRRDVADDLNGCLASTLDLFLQTKTAHWNIHGPLFTALHPFFDVLADHLRGDSDKIAERVAALGHRAAGTVQSVANRTPLTAYDVETTGEMAHLEALASRFSAHAMLLRTVALRVREIEPVTENLLLDVLTRLEKDLWMLESHHVAAASPVKEPARRAA